MNIRDYLADCERRKREQTQLLLEERTRAREAVDAYWDELSDVLEQHPPGMPGVRR